MFSRVRLLSLGKHSASLPMALTASALVVWTGQAFAVNDIDFLLHRAPDSDVTSSLRLDSGLALAAAAAPIGGSEQIEPGPVEQSISGEARLRRNRVKIDPGTGDAAFRTDQAKGVRGDRDAAFRVAQMYRRGSNGAPRDERKMVQWLLHASSLNSGAASYQLYLYYLNLKLDRDAVYFENRALEQGYTPPPRLDPRRG